MHPGGSAGSGEATPAFAVLLQCSAGIASDHACSTEAVVLSGSALFSGRVLHQHIYRVQA